MSQDNLQRQLGLWPATAMVISGMIAVGIFLVPAGMAKSLGSPLVLLVIWLLMAIMALSGSLCYGELASRYPEAGGDMFICVKRSVRRRHFFMAGCR